MNIRTFNLIAQLEDQELSLRAAMKFPPAYRYEPLNRIVRECVQQGQLETARAAAELLVA